MFCVLHGSSCVSLIVTEEDPKWGKSVLLIQVRITNRKFNSKVSTVATDALTWLWKLHSSNAYSNATDKS